MKILLADDDVMFRKSVERYLRTFGHEIATVPNLDAARDVLANEEFDVEIYDGTLKYPHDGVEFAIDRWKLGKKVILCTGMSNPKIPEGLPFVQKPNRAGLAQYLDEFEKNLPPT
jgi:DNA-binding NtrC family response regulator